MGAPGPSGRYDAFNSRRCSTHTEAVLLSSQTMYSRINRSFLVFHHLSNAIRYLNFGNLDLIGTLLHTIVATVLHQVVLYHPK